MTRRVELLLLAFAAGVFLALTLSPAIAYMGPGGGLALLTTALAMLAAFSISTIVVLTWPVRAMKGWLQRRREKRKAKKDGKNADEEHAQDKR